MIQCPVCRAALQGNEASQGFGTPCCPCDIALICSIGSFAWPGYINQVFGDKSSPCTRQQQKMRISGAISQALGWFICSFQIAYT